MLAPLNLTEFAFLGLPRFPLEEDNFDALPFSKLEEDCCMSSSSEPLPPSAFLSPPKKFTPLAESALVFDRALAGPAGLLLALSLSSSPLSPLLESEKVAVDEDGVKVLAFFNLARGFDLRDGDARE